MPIRVVSESEVNLDGTFFPVIRAVQEIPQNIFPPKRVDGDYTRDSNPRLSSITWSDFRGGIGLDVMQGNQTDRCFTSTCSIRFKRSLTLGPLVITSDSAAPPTDGGVFVLGQQNSFAWAVWGNDIYAYGDIADNWTDSTEEAGAGGAFVSDTLNMQLDGDDYLIIATTAGYRHHRGSSVTTNWGTSTKDVVYLASWDDRLWGINIRGDLWYSFIPGTETDAGELKSNISDATPRRLFTGPDANGEQILYALSDDGLFAYDAANERFLKTNIPLQFGTRGGIGGAFNSGAGLWNSLIYLSVNTSIYEYNPFQGSIRLIGPNDVDDGLPTNRRGTMTSLAFSTKELFVVVTAHSTDATADAVYAWDGRGWYEIFSTTDTNDTIKDIRVLSGSETTAYRLWMGQSGTTDAALYIDLPTNFENPKQTTDFVYAAAGELRTPWFHADQVDVDKLAVRAKIETADTNSNETVTLSYALDYNDDIYNQFDTITTNGVKVLDFSKWHTYLDFNGTSGDVTVSDATSIQNQFDGGAGLSARISADSDGENSEGFIFAKGSGNDIFSFRTVNELSGKVGLRWVYPFSSTNGNWTTTSTELNLGEFYRVGVEYDNGSVANNPTFLIYREATRTLTTLTVGSGITETTAPVGTRTTDVGNDFLIGNRANGGRTADAQIDDVRWYGTTGILATEDRDNELIGNESNLIGYWKLNENTGSTANDSSDLNSNNGTISTATYVENTDKAGMSFKAIRFKINLVRGGTTTNSPRLVSLTLEHRKKLDYKQGFRVQLDLKKEYKTKPPKDLRSALQETLEAKSLVEFTYRNDTGDTRNFWVDTFLQQGLEQTGYNETGTAVVDLLEA